VYCYYFRTISALEASACIAALKKHVFPRFCKDHGEVTPPLLDCSVGPAWLSSASVYLGVTDDLSMSKSFLRDVSAKPFCCGVMASFSAVAGTIPPATAAPRCMPAAALLLPPLPAPTSSAPDP